MSMSTPIHQLPATPTATAAPPTDDPEVLSMLNEMEREVQEATKHHQQPMMRPTPPPAIPPMPMVKKPTQKKLWDQTIAQKAVVYAVIAMVVFYPATLAFVYSKVPKFEALFTSYDFIIRTAVLAIALYAAIMYLPF